MEKENEIPCYVCKVFYKKSDTEKHKAYHDAIEQNRPALERLGEKIRKIINPYW